MSPLGIGTSQSEAAEKFAALTEIVGTELGEPSPVDGYRHRPDEAVRNRLKGELEEAERALAAAAARLHTLYAD